MIIFTTIINFIEAFIFPYFLSHYFHINQKNRFITLSGTIQLILLLVCTYFNKSNYLLTIFIILINIVSLYFSKIKMSFSVIFTTILYNFLILVTSYIDIYGSYLLSTFFSVSIEGNMFIIVASSLAKLVLLCVTLVILKLKTNLDFELNILNWKSLLFFQMLLVITFVIVGYTMVQGSINKDSLILLSLILFVSNLYFIFIISKINNLYKEKIKYEKELQQERFHKEKMMLISDIKNDIDAIDHRLFYVILEIENLLEINDISRIKKLVKEYKNIILKHKMIINTKNDTFDCLLSLKINDLVMNNVDVKTCLFISKNKKYDNLQFIHILIELLNYLNTSTFIDLDLNEISEFLKIRIVFNKDTLDIIDLEKMVDNLLIDFEVSKKLMNLDDKKTELSIVMKVKENI